MRANYQVEQDLITSRALVELFSDDFLRENLAFRGGTALHKLFLNPAPRYSESAWKKTLNNGGQLFTYAKQAGSTQFISLYASDFLDGKVVSQYYLITLKDNKKRIEELADESLLSYDKAKGLDVEDIFNTWKETYRQDYATKGIFESDIPAYAIGKTKYSLKDLNIISSKDLQGKYHEFV
ncbi:MAG: nucleotidyl transferase AbiEii/AbiGii toxin family protein [Cyclobacteriaceae bacterium]